MGEYFFVIYSLGCTFLPCLLYQIVLLYTGSRRGKQFRAVYFIWVYIFLLYIWMVFRVTGVGVLGDMIVRRGLIADGTMNLRPFDGVGIGYFLNIIMCMPLGFLLPLIWKECRNLKRITVTGLLFSAVIEASQLLNFRATDIDDLTANVGGTIIGYLFWRVFIKIFGVHLKLDTVDIDDMEMVVSTCEIRLPARYVKGSSQMYMFLAFAGHFVLYNPYLFI